MEPSTIQVAEFQKFHIQKSGSKNQQECHLQFVENSGRAYLLEVSRHEAQKLLNLLHLALKD